MPRWPALIFTLLFFSLLPVQAQSLSSLKWKNRILILMDPAGATEARDKQLLAFQELDAALQERDLLIFCYDGGRLLSRDLEPSPCSLPEKVDKNFQGVILLGKDGGVKRKAPYPVTPKSIFALIDSMPMRRAEFRKTKEY